MSRGIGTVVAVVAAVLICAPPAPGAMTLGETFVPATINSCLGEFEVVQTGRASGTSYAAPASGVLTAWSFQAGAQQTVLTMRVFRPTGTPHHYTVIADASEFKTVPASSGLHTFPTQIAVQTGDLIGIHGLSGRCATETGNAADTYDFRQGGAATLPVGGTGAYSTLSGFIFDISAQLEPDCDNDGLGDETQDAALSLGEACGKGNRSLTLDANKNKVKRKKKVRLSGHLESAAQSCEAGQAVALQRKRPKQATFTTFAQLQTDAQGSFSAKKKLKKTTEFRVQVPETATCDDGLSNTEKVKVKKRRR